MALPEQNTFSDEKLKEYDSVPLFMRSLPEPGELTDDTAISALQSLIHEGTPDEVAQNFKEQGNEYFRDKRYREALGFYKQGIDAKPENKTIQENLLCNRAACNLELQNYGSVLRDCSEAIRLNTSCSKAYYRSALALLSLDRPDEALDAAIRGLENDRSNAGLLGVRQRSEKAKSVKDEKERRHLEASRSENIKKERLRNAFKERNIIDRPKEEEAQDAIHVPYFDDTEDPPILIFPVFFLYPQYAQSDIVPSLREDTLIGDQLSSMFPPGAEAPSWDANGEYVVGKLVVYAVTYSQRILKVGMRLTLRDVFKAAESKDGKRDGLELRDGYLTLVVLTKGDAEKAWINEFKETRERNK